MFSKTALVESAKELARVILLAIIPVILMGVNPETGKMMIDFQLVVATGLIALLRALDKFLHESGKEFENETLSKGLTRF